MMPGVLLIQPLASMASTLVKMVFAMTAHTDVLLASILSAKFAWMASTSTLASMSLITTTLSVKN